MSTEVEIFDAELVEGGIVVRPAAAQQGPRYLVTQHAMLAPGHLPPLADERPAWGDENFRLPPRTLPTWASPISSTTPSRTVTPPPGPFRSGAQPRSRRGSCGRARPRPTPPTACI